jgi:hypothetical protein
MTEAPRRRRAAMPDELVDDGEDVVRRGLTIEHGSGHPPVALLGPPGQSADAGYLHHEKLGGP